MPQILTGGLRRLWFRRPRPNPDATVRLVCFPHGGGGASAYHRWAEHMPATVELLAVQYPGHEDRVLERCVTDMDTLVHRVCHGLDALLDRRLALFGHSMGAAVAYEVAKRLEAGARRSADWLFVSGLAAPHRRPPDGLDLDDDESLIAGVRGLGGTDELVLEDRELRDLVLDPLRVDSRLIEEYRACVRVGPRLRAPIAAFIGDADDRVSTAQAEAWGDLTAGGFSLRVFPGGHFYLLEHREALLAELTSRLPDGRPE